MSTESGITVETVNIEKFSVVLVDIAGTTTSISFVQDELFPFVTKQVEEFLKSQWEEETVKEAVKHLKSDEELDITKTVELVKKLTKENSDNKGLKQIQGLIYKKGYTEGTIKGHVFADVPESFENWSKTKKIAVFSTGSVESQKLLFANSVKGDLSKYISDYFDQVEIGAKNEAESYKKIAGKLAVKIEDIVFITDNADEAKAAQSAGASVALITRVGNANIPEDIKKGYSVVSSFKDLLLENAAKRKNPEEVGNTEAPPTKVPKTDEKTDAKEEKPEKTTESKAEETMEIDEEKMENEQIESVINAFIDEETKKIIQESKNKSTENGKEPKTDEKTPEEQDKKEETEKKEEVKGNEEKTNGEKAENGETKVVEEKENKSVLANGVENGTKSEANAETEEKNTEKTEGSEEVKKDETECKTDETDIKVKKLEETATENNKTVNVEV